jgi:hypothetical protein
MNKLPLNHPWQPELNWDTAAGKALSTLLEGLHNTKEEWLVNIFGSAPLQMAYAQDFISNDIDISVAWQKEPEFEKLIHNLGLDRNNAELYIQSCKEAAFRTSPKWKDRAFLSKQEKVTLRFAHPIDILIGKLNRLEPKDFKAFYLVKAATGEPTEENLLQELRDAPELFSHAYMAPHGQASYTQNVATFWQGFYEKAIDVEKQIIIPANETLKQNYDIGGNYKASLKAIATKKHTTRTDFTPQNPLDPY